MPIVKCVKCKKEFYAKPSWLKIGWGKYCSPKCQHEGQLRGKLVKCFICKKEVWKAPKALSHSKCGKYFCGKSCQTVWRNSMVFIGKKHPNWKNGETIYRKILERSKKEKACLLCGIEDKRILAVHHLDKNQKNIDLKNLIWLCHNCHFLVHHDKETKEKLMAVVV